MNSNCDLKVADFGLARVLATNDSASMVPMTGYVTTRWYRAPEVILEFPPYGLNMDLWAVGTILAELLGRKPLFPGRDSLDQLTLIISMLGRPGEPVERNSAPQVC